MSPELVRAALTILFGAIAGGVTNTLAIWMLFHPYQPPRILGRRLGWLQGAIPKNRPRLARTMGQMVGTRLLTPEDLARELREPTFRAAFDERLREFLDAALQREHRSLDVALPAEIAGELRRLATRAADALLDRLDAHMERADFEVQVEAWLEEMTAGMGDQRLGELLGEARRASLAGGLERWLAEVTHADWFEATVAAQARRLVERGLEPGRTLRSLLPDDAAAALDQAAAAYLPLALERLGGLVEQPAVRVRVEAAVHAVVERFIRDLRFHQRLVASLVITPQLIDRILEAVEAEGAEKIGEMLREPEVRDAMAAGLSDALAELLEKPTRDIFGAPDSPGVEAFVERLTSWIIEVARDPRMHAAVGARAGAALDAAGAWTWSELTERVPTATIASAIVAAARSKQGRGLCRETARWAVDGIMARPLGRPADYLPHDTAARVENALADPLWRWLQEEVPLVARRVDIAARVEEKILAYPLPRLEELVRSVTERELRTIVRLGYLLGALIGTILVSLHQLLG